MVEITNFLVTVLCLMKGVALEVTIITQCGCFMKNDEDNSVIPVTLKECEMSFSFICCAALKIKPGANSRELCCLDKRNIQAPPLFERCQLTDKQYENLENIFGKKNVAYHRQTYKNNSTFDQTDEQLTSIYRSNIIFGMMSIVVFFCLISLCFFSKFCKNFFVRRLEHMHTTSAITECYLLQNLNTQSILRDFNPYSPYAFAPPQYDTLPKEPPRYSRIYLLENETTQENNASTQGSRSQQVNEIQNRGAVLERLGPTDSNNKSPSVPVPKDTVVAGQIRRTDTEP